MPATRFGLLAALVLPAAAQQVDWVQTARFRDGSVTLLQDMPAMQMESMSEPPTSHTLEVDTRVTFQEILGFGGAFTEATAINWRKLSKADQDEVIRLYFAPPEQGGHGYTLGRVPINSCDFSPASYNFDNFTGDVELTRFDKSVKHDVEVGMIPMILQAQAMVEARGMSLSMYASPWSPPAWMKLPAWGQQSMLLSASPNGLDPSYQAAWAKYFSKFISAYRKQGIELWGVTVQNEPEAAVGWEACLWTPDFMASFVRDHLGPTLAADHPGVKIIGFDHNKDHLAMWADGLYKDPEAAKWFYGIGVHWYGGLNTHNLNYTHYLAPSKVILGTEACNCGGVVFREPVLSAWWSRAESLALDILEDLRYWAVGWTDWNLVLNPQGGPNHLKNLCDANIITDHEQALGMGTLILQASYYYMGHFSRYFPPGAKRVALKNSVETHAPPLSPNDVKNGQALLFAPCDGNDVQKWVFDETGSLIVKDTNEAPGSEGYEHDGECMDLVTDTWITGKLQVWACAHSGNQLWEVRPVAGGSQLFHPPSGQCVTAVQTSGIAVGLDQGVTIVAAQLKPCADAGDPVQTFSLANYDAQGFPGNFPVRTLSSAPGGGELCLQPQIVRVPHFDAVAFQAPDGMVALVAMNIGDNPVNFNLVDKAAHTGLTQLVIPPHAIHTYRWRPPALPQTSAAVVQPATAAATPVQSGGAVGGGAVGSDGSSGARTAAPATGAVDLIAASSVPPGFAVDQRRPRVSTAQPNADYYAAGRAQAASGGREQASPVLPLLAGVAVAAAAALVAVRVRRRPAAEHGGAWAACERSNDYEEFHPAHEERRS